jgi:hypothetical protein
MVDLWLNMAVVMVAAGAVTYFSVLDCTTWFGE